MHVCASGAQHEEGARAAGAGDAAQAITHGTAAEVSAPDCVCVCVCVLRIVSTDKISAIIMLLLLLLIVCLPICGSDVSKVHCVLQRQGWGAAEAEGTGQGAGCTG